MMDKIAKQIPKFDAGDPEQVLDIISNIDDGAYGMVYKAIDKRNNNLLVLKVMSYEKAHVEELNRIATCSSPYLINNSINFMKDNVIWIGMEYYAGTIHDILKISDKSLTEIQIQIIVKDCLKGLQYLHSKGLSHRELKAESIYISDNKNDYLNAPSLINGYIREIIHFPQELINIIEIFYGDAKGGACKLSEIAYENIHQPAHNGIPYWLPPETYLPVDHDSHSFCTAVDIWRLGITCIEMATGKVPHHDKPPLQAIYLISKSDSPTLPKTGNWSQEFEHFISLCLKKDPQDRPTATQLLNHKFIQFAQGIHVLYDSLKGIIPQLEPHRIERTKQIEEMYGSCGTSTYNDEDDDDEDDEYLYDTMISYNNFTAKPKAKHKAQESYDDYANKQLPPTPNINIQSIFSDTDLLKINFEIPLNSTKSEIQKIRERINDLYDADVVTLKEYYDDQLVIIDNKQVINKKTNVNTKSNKKQLINTVSFEYIKRIPENQQLIVFGFIHKIEKDYLKNKTPDLVIYVCLYYYYTTGRIKSLFTGTNILKHFSISSNTSKAELKEIRTKVNNLYDLDVVALEAFYDEQLQIVDNKLAQTKHIVIS